MRFGRFRKATRPPWSLVWIVTSSQPSWPKLLSMRASLWSGIGATWYSHFVMGRTLLAANQGHPVG